MNREATPQAEARALVLAPIGRDAELAQQLLEQAGLSGEVCETLSGLVGAIDEGVGYVVVTDDVLFTSDLSALSEWLRRQPSWSDLPFILLVRRDGGVDRNPAILRLLDVLGNVTLLERPLHPLTFVGAAKSAHRSRQRQYQARATLIDLSSQSASLVESEDRFRTLADNLPVLCWMAEGNGWIFWYNRRWYDYTGTTPDSMEGWGWESVHHPDFLPEVLRRWQHSIHNGEPFEMTFPLKGADGVFRPFLTRVVPVRDEAGEVRRWFGTNADVSEIVASEAALRHSEERLRFALMAGGLGSWTYDPKRDLLESSDLFKALVGVDPSESLTQQRYFALVHEDDRAAMEDRVNEALQGHYDGDYTLSYRVRWPSGRQRWLEDRGRTIRSPSGELQLTGVTFDVTERHLAEQQLQELNAELERRVEQRSAELEAAMAEWQRAEEKLRQSQKMEALGQLTGGIAHDFNNLLTGIMGSVDMIRQRIAKGRVNEVDRFVDAATRSAQNAATLTHRLLAFSRKQSLEYEHFDANQLLASMEELLRRSLGEQVRLVIEPATEPLAVSADRTQLENALLNLAINARDAMPEGGTLTLSTGRYRHLADELAAPDSLASGDYVAISVRDTGCGMAPEMLEKVFEPFFTTKPIGKGTGLGLSMVYGFAKQSGGSVRIDSAPGEGTVVTLLLPQQKPSEDDVVAKSTQVNLPPGRGETLLVVEDDPSVRLLLTESLEELGYVTLVASDAPTAIPLLESPQGIDLMVSDIGLPGMNGRQLADLARQKRPQLKVLFVSGYAEKAAVRGEFLGENMDMLTKPFQIEALASKVRQMLSR